MSTKIRLNMNLEYIAVGIDEIPCSNLRGRVRKINLYIFCNVYILLFRKVSNILV